MDAHFDHDVSELPLPFFIEERTDIFQDNFVNSTVDLFGTELIGRRDPDLSLDFPIEPMSAGIGAQLEYFDSELLDAALHDFDLGGSQSFEGGLDRPQYPTSTLGNPYTVQESLPFHQEVDVSSFHNLAMGPAPIGHAQNDAMGNAARFNPTQGLHEWDTSLLSSYYGEPSSGFQLLNSLPLDDSDVHLPLLSLPERQIHTADPLAGDTTGNEHFQTGTRTSTLALMGTQAVTTSLHPFPQMASAEPVEPTNCPATVTYDHRARLKEPTSQDWNQLGPLVCVLYYKYPLEKVCDILKHKHGYKISEKMLRDRLRKWERGKNIKSKEMKAILDKLPTRERVHKRSDIRIRSMPVSITKVKRYRKIDGSTLRDELNRIKSPTPPTLEIRTPPASPLATPCSLRIPEELMKCVRDYVFGAFEEKIWISTGVAEQLQLKGGDALGAQDVLHSIIGALKSVNIDQYSEAEAYISRADRGLERTISSQPYELIYGLFNCITFSLITRNDVGFVLPIIKHSSSTAIKLLGDGHRLARVINLVYLLLREAENTSLLAGIESAWLCAVDSLEFALLPLHCVSLMFRLAYINYVSARCDYEHGLSTMRRLLRKCDEVCYGLEDLRPLEVRIYLAQCLGREGCGQFKDAIIIITEVIERTQQPGFPPQWISYYTSEAYWNLGWSQMMLRQNSASEESLREAIRIKVTAFGSQNPRAQMFKMTLENWLRDWGRMEAADELRCQSLADFDSTSELELTYDDDDSDFFEEDSDFVEEEDSDKQDIMQ